jgi:hypothetical protein
MYCIFEIDSVLFNSKENLKQVGRSLRRLIKQSGSIREVLNNLDIIGAKGA